MTLLPPRLATHGVMRIALAGLLALAWADLSRCHRARMRARPKAKPESLQTWEGEGGGIPAVRGSNTPRPAGGNP